MILIDTSVWVDFLRQRETPQTDRLVTLLLDDDSLIAIGDLVVMEILQGAKDDLRARRIESRLSHLIQITISDPALAVAAAANYRLLRTRGITIRKTIDTLIATRCIVDDYALLYSDRDFDPFVEHLGLRSAMA